MAEFDELVTAQTSSQEYSDVTCPSPVSPWDKVLNALEDPKWDFRTVDSIAQETSLDPSDVQGSIG